MRSFPVFFAMIALGLAVTVAMPGPKRGANMMGPGMMLGDLVHGPIFGPTPRLVRMMTFVESECFRRLKITLPDSMKNRRVPVSEEDDTDDDDVPVDGAGSGSGAAAGRNNNASAAQENNVTYNDIRAQFLDMMTAVTKPMEARMTRIDKKLAMVDEAAKLIGSFDEKQMKDMLMCMHAVALQEPLQEEKKAMAFVQRLACDMRMKMTDKSVDQCPKA